MHTAKSQKTQENFQRGQKVDRKQHESEPTSRSDDVAVYTVLFQAAESYRKRVVLEVRAGGRLISSTSIASVWVVDLLGGNPSSCTYT